MNNWPDKLMPALGRVFRLENWQIECLQELKAWAAFKIKRKKELTKHIEKMLKSVKKDSINMKLTQETVDRYFMLVEMSKVNALLLSKKEGGSGYWNIKRNTGRG